MKKTTRSFLVLFTTILFFSCSDDDSPKDLVDVSNDIEPDIFPFIQTFVDEAAARNISFDFRGFEATFSEEDIDDNGDICGRASAFSDNTNTITIRNSESCWIDRPDATREALVFHELGHALLDRPHRDDRFDNGLVRSIMETGTLGPYSEFSPLLMAYLFDEMFDETTEIPEWALNKTVIVPFDINSDLEESDGGWNLLTTLNGSTQGIITGSRTTDDAASGDFSLTITSSQSVDETHFWRMRLVDVTGLPETADLNLEAKVRLQSVQGEGILVGGAIDVDGEIISSGETENLTGTTNGFQTFNVTIPYWPNRSATLTILLLVLPETTGVVYFDDITLNAAYNPAFGPA